MTVLTFPRISRGAGAAPLPGTWKLGARRAVALRPDWLGELRVAHGVVWVTLDGPHGATPDDAGDLVLHAGQSVRIAPGQHAVLESWGADAAAYFTWDPIFEPEPVRVPVAAAVLQPLADLRQAIALGAGALGRLAAGLAGLAVRTVWPRPRAVAAPPACCPQGAMS